MLQNYGFAQSTKVYFREILKAKLYYIVNLVNTVQIRNFGKNEKIREIFAFREHKLLYSIGKASILKLIRITNILF